MQPLKREREAVLSEGTFRIEGEFNGYDYGAVFRLSNGRVYQQTSSRYRYRYAYRPNVKIFREGGRLHLQEGGMGEAVQIVEVQIIDEGTIISEFNGFDGSSRFKFNHGSVWQQAEYKYEYHYAYMPEAVVIEGINGTELHVEGMTEAVQVRRIK